MTEGSYPLLYVPAATAVKMVFTAWEAVCHPYSPARQLLPKDASVTKPWLSQLKLIYIVQSIYSQAVAYVRRKGLIRNRFVGIPGAHTQLQKCGATQKDNLPSFPFHTMIIFLYYASLAHSSLADTLRHTSRNILETLYEAHAKDL